MPGACRSGPLEVSPRLFEGQLDVVTQRQVCGNRRRKRAARAVRVPSRESAAPSARTCGRPCRRRRASRRPSRCPPLTTTTRAPSARIRRAAMRMSSRDRIVMSASISASGMFGVTTIARRSSSAFTVAIGFLDEQPIAALRDHHGIDNDAAADRALRSLPRRPRRWRQWRACRS